ncbi:dolichyl-phosphate-mannose-proteinmannosyltransferase [Wickerhamomyces ciferrii]|uniref:Dolichyl-phosphate-mannose--protein mannosyltransferase n=1 Tax=Wickerhamomyces ciferrii (strain ATCC 14091 / BCRC 22168 / CBS 111 / JCM 3599 / NBRC 0793 / NRRL Y-1031 F-60-10) TaxID=1206466 RepID=K0KBW5_WICCF|nr:dolichyl-phosphate-mannose-proteinmannosyltransferase [Wickerhamomyces ciferrii]CCH42560.1 dolichyl-phosphate-mannose-proteinmannosyltransferase [Wickerhamomyces ciferrii]
MSGLRKRTTKGTSKKDLSTVSNSSDEKLLETVQKSKDNEKPTDQTDECPLLNKISLAVVTILAFVTRIYKIDYPSEVVFDEVHFGKFASYYLQRTYFFDLHPPFAKLLIALVGYLVGYDGSFKFDNIGDSYIDNKVPYVAYRLLSAVLGSVTVPIIYLTLKELNYSIPTAVFGSLLVLFDNAHVAETRLILLDAVLILSVALSIYSYIRFYKEQANGAYTKGWFKWLILTGVSLSCVISTKYVGVFTYITIGFAVALDLWSLLDIESGLTIRQFIRHFVARFYSLIVLPFLIYLYWFYVHFEILTRSGPGDGFMSSEFQESLGDSPLAKTAKQVNYYDIVTFKHKGTDALLHSHGYRYPLRYEDGRVSSQGQQVTGFIGEDINNQWQVLPVEEFPEDNKLNKPVRIDDIVRFLHVNTGTYLLSHDVASPLYPTNEEFTTVDYNTSITRFNETLFKLPAADKSNKRSIIKTKSSLLRVLHVDTTVALWTHDDVTLPEWGFNQLEVNGNKKIQDSTNTWYFDEIIGLNDSRQFYVPKPVKKIPFFKKWWELQFIMFEQNNKLSSEHPFASDPISWPGSLSGVSFWTKEGTKEQIYFIGNLFGWWLEVIALASFAGFFAAVKLVQQRKIYVLKDIQIKQLFNIGFLYIGYLSHYVFFFLMARQKFLHHYLPAHLIAAILTAAILEFLVGRGKVLNITIVVLSIGLIYSFYFFAPITYGNVGLTPDQVGARQFLNIKLHFYK